MSARRLSPSAVGISIVLHAGLLLSLPTLGNRWQPGSRPDALAFTATLKVSPPGPSRPDLPPKTEEPVREGGEEPQLSDGLGVLPVSPPAYFTADKLTKPPKAIAVPDLGAPEIQQVAGSGKLVLKLWIDDQGAVVDAAPEPNALPEIFSRTAVEAFKRSRFTPGERDGVKVGSLIRVELSYYDVPAGPAPATSLQ